MIQCKPVDEPVAAEDGRRVLVDRLWPRNWPKATASLHAWLPDLAPAIDLPPPRRTAIKKSSPQAPITSFLGGAAFQYIGRQIR